MHLQLLMQLKINNNFDGQKTLRAKLLEFFEQHAPAKTATVDILIEKFKDEDASAVISKLEVKYNLKMPADTIHLVQMAY